MQNILNKIKEFFLSSEVVLKDKNKGMKIVYSDTQITAEWDSDSEVSKLKFLKLLYNSTLDKKKRNSLKKEFKNLKSKLLSLGYEIEEIDL